MNGAIVITWGTSVPGREQKGMEVFTKALAHFDHLAKQGRVHSHHEYFSVIGSSGGMMIVDGPLDELLKVQTEDATLRLMAQAEAIVQDFTVRVCAGGTEGTVQESVTRYVESIQELGYM